MAHIFISYSRTDETFARRLTTSLSKCGADVWIDLQGIPVGKKWSSAIQQALQESEVMIVIVSPASMASENVEDEWQDFRDNKKPLIPVLYRAVPTRNIHFQLRRIQRIDFLNQPYHIAFRQLHEELRRNDVKLNPIPPDEDAASASTSPFHNITPSTLFSVLVSRSTWEWIRTKGAQYYAAHPRLHPNLENLKYFAVEYPRYFWSGVIALVAAVLLMLMLIFRNHFQPPLAIVAQPTLTATTAPPSATPTSDAASQALTLTARVPPASPTTNTTPGAEVLTSGIVSSNQGVNVRSGPSTSNGVIAILQPGSPVIVLESTGDGNWYRIRIDDGKEGWVAAGLLAVTPTSTPTPDPLLGKSLDHPVIANAQWIPQFQFFQGVEMALVPVGCFEIGNDSGAFFWNGASNVQGVIDGGRICFQRPFWMDKTEVTNVQFTAMGGIARNDSTWNDANHPRENITWFEARDFCVKRGGRLPTEAEWEYAARGPDHLLFPWGDQFVPDNVVFNRTTLEGTAEVGTKPKGASWVGLLDIIGNISEWTGTINRDYPYDLYDGRDDASSIVDTRRSVRGSAWDYGRVNSLDILRAASRNWFGPTYYSDNLGVRCVHDYDG